MRELLDSLFDRDASDVILSAGAPPVFRIDGQLERYRDEPLSPDDTDSLVRELLAPQQRITFSEQNAVDFSFQWGQRGRIRIDVDRPKDVAQFGQREDRFGALFVPHAEHRFARMREGAVPEIVQQQARAQQRALAVEISRRVERFGRVDAQRVERARPDRERAERVREARVLRRREREIRQAELAQAAQALHGR